MLEEAPDQRAPTEQPNEPGFGSEMIHYNMTNIRKITAVSCKTCP